MIYCSLDEFKSTYSNTGNVKILRNLHRNPVTAVPNLYVADNYEALSIGIGGYNQGYSVQTTYFRNITGAQKLKDVRPTSTCSAQCELIKYAIEVKSQLGGTLNLRDYEWQGQKIVRRSVLLMVNQTGYKARPGRIVRMMLLTRKKLIRKRRGPHALKIYILFFNFYLCLAKSTKLC